MAFPLISKTLVQIPFIAAIPYLLAKTPMISTAFIPPPLAF